MGTSVSQAHTRPISAGEMPARGVLQGPTERLTRGHRVCWCAQVVFFSSWAMELITPTIADNAHRGGKTNRWCHAAASQRTRINAKLKGGHPIAGNLEKEGVSMPEREGKIEFMGAR